MLSKMARPEGGMSVERLSDGAIEIIDELHTERLDYTSEYLPLIDAANKLDAYEDTGLEPEEIEQLKGEVFGLKVDKQELEKYRALGPIDRLRELVEVDREGRCSISAKLICMDEVTAPLPEQYSWIIGRFLKGEMDGKDL